MQFKKCCLVLLILSAHCFVMRWRFQQTADLNYLRNVASAVNNLNEGDRVKQDELWNDLTSQLNANGPPTRDVAMWKKTWCGWRRSIKTRLAENKASIKKTGGGDFQQHYLSPIDEQLAIICDIFQAVEGVTMAKTFGGSIKKKCDDNVKGKTTIPRKVSQDPQFKPPPASISRTTDPQFTPPTSSLPEISDMSTPQRKRKCLNGDILNVMEEEKENFKYVAAKIEEVNETLKNQSRYLRNLNKNIDELRSIKKKELEEAKKHQLKMEKIAMERNALKLEFLKLEKLKMGIIDD